MAATYKSWASNDVLNAADQMTYLMKQVNIKCTATSDISSPAEGWRAMDTALDRESTYDGTNWVPTGRWGSAGRIGGRWRRGSTLAVAVSTTLTVTFDTEDADSDAWLTPTSGTITVPTGRSGWLTAQLTLVFAADPGNSSAIYHKHTRSGTLLMGSTEMGSAQRANDGAGTYFMSHTFHGFVANADTLVFEHRNPNGEDITLAWLDLLWEGP